MSKAVVVTGGAGFIGRKAIAELNRRGVSNILVVDDHGTDDKWQNLRGRARRPLLCSARAGL